MSCESPPLIIAADEASALAGLALVASGEAWGLVYVEDIEPGRMEVRTYLARGHEHRASELADLVRRASDRGGFEVVDPARLTRRGAA